MQYYTIKTLCTSLLWSVFHISPNQPSKLEMRTSTTVVLGQSESLLITDAGLQQARGVMINPDNPVGVRSVAIDSGTGSLKLDPIDGQFLDDLVSFVCVTGAGGEVVVNQVSNDESAIFEIRSPHQSTLRFRSANSIPSLPIPLISTNGDVIVLPSSINDQPRLRENFAWAMLRDESWEVSSLVFEAKVKFGSYRLSHDRVYFLDRSTEVAGMYAVSYVDIEASKLVSTSLHAIDVVPCHCGLWVLDTNGSAVLHGSDQLDDQIVDGDNPLAFRDAKIIFGHRNLDAVGGVSADGSFWSHRCHGGVSKSKPFMNKTEVASIVTAGWVLQRDAFWIQTTEKVDPEIEIITATIYEILDSEL